MSTGTLVLLIFVTSLLAAVIALGVSGNLGQLTLAPSPPGAGSGAEEVQKVATQRSEDGGAPQASQESDPATQTSPQPLSSAAQEPATGTTARDKEPPASSTKRAQRRKKKSRRARSQKKQTSSLPNQGDESARGSLGGTEGTNEYTPSGLSPSSDEDNGSQTSAPSLDVVPSANIGTEFTAPPSPEPVTPTQPEGPAMGFLYLSAQPECEVSIDGKSYGTTKKTNKGLILREGAYKVRFVCHDEALCAQFNKRAGVKTLKVYADRATRYEANFYRLNE